MTLTRFCLLAGSAAAIISTLGCESPDPEARLDEFADIREGFLRPPSELCDTVIEDISGRYMFGVETGILARAGIMFETTITSTGDNEYRFELQPLARDVDDEPRVPVGDLITVNGVTVDAAGEFQLSLVDVAVPGRANPVTGGEIFAPRMDLVGAICGEGFLCGAGDADVTSPLVITTTLDMGAEFIGDDVIDADTPVFSACDDTNPASTGR